MPAIRCLAFVVACVNFLGIALADTAVDVPRTLSRSKRYLVFPEGSNVQVKQSSSYRLYLGEQRSTGLDGRACVMRALCEAAQRDPQELGTGSLVQELLHAIFTFVYVFHQLLPQYSL
ncbi:uncharacterized protein LOC108621997 [Ceratina calcarata]|uniref:Uncharacterized protein LOC108621997 n=1 Tax=Ceratina calcarata TaxID=156304 RepID=A0AAJ7IRY7_9HYME|nr:uncharacterized protein LOC108621997 [Ceratina calcarata]